MYSKLYHNFQKSYVKEPLFGYNLGQRTEIVGQNLIQNCTQISLKIMGLISLHNL
jgi:hypothetical protein